LRATPRFPFKSGGLPAHRGETGQYRSNPGHLPGILADPWSFCVQRARGLSARPEF
jgi:hypothetical protein